MTSSIAIRGKPTASYFKLVKSFPLRPLRNEIDLDQAITVVHALVDRFGKLDADEAAYLAVLSDLVKKYEDEHHLREFREARFSDGEMLAYLIEQKDVTQSEIARQTGIAESTVSSVLKGTRKLNREHIGKLAEFFGVQPGVFQFVA